MMKGFEDVTLSWNDEDFVVPADQQLMLIAEIEDALTGSSGDQAIQLLLRPGGPPHSRLAVAYAKALRYAGAKVSDQDVYLALVGGIGSGEAANIQGHILAMISIIAPPIHSAIMEGVDDELEKNQPAKAVKPIEASSEPSTD